MELSQSNLIQALRNDQLEEYIKNINNHENYSVESFFDRNSFGEFIHFNPIMAMNILKNKTDQLINNHINNIKLRHKYLVQKEQIKDTKIQDNFDNQHVKTKNQVNLLKSNIEDDDNLLECNKWHFLKPLWNEALNHSNKDVIDQIYDQQTDKNDQQNEYKNQIMIEQSKLGEIEILKSIKDQIDEDYIKQFWMHNKSLINHYNSKQLCQIYDSQLLKDRINLAKVYHNQIFKLLNGFKKDQFLQYRSKLMNFTSMQLEKDMLYDFKLRDIEDYELFVKKLEAIHQNDKNKESRISLLHKIKNVYKLDVVFTNSYASKYFVEQLTNFCKESIKLQRIIKIKNYQKDFKDDGNFVGNLVPQVKIQIEINTGIQKEIVQINIQQEISYKLENLQQIIKELYELDYQEIYSKNDKKTKFNKMVERTLGGDTKQLVDLTSLGILNIEELRKKILLTEPEFMYEQLSTKEINEMDSNFKDFEFQKNIKFLKSYSDIFNIKIIKINRKEQNLTVSPINLRNMKLKNQLKLKNQNVLKSIDFRHKTISFTIENENAQTQIAKILNLSKKMQLSKFKSQSTQNQSIMSQKLLLDSSKILCGCDDNSLRVISLKNGECLKKYKEHEDWARCVDLSKDQNSAISAGYDNKVYWQSLNSGAIHKLKSHKDMVTTVCMNSNGNRAQSGSQDCTLKVWDLTKFNCIYSMVGHDKSIRSICLTSDDNFLISGSSDCSVKVWDTFGGKLALVEVLLGHLKGVRCVNLSGPGNRIASGAEDHAVRIWSVSQAQCWHVFEGHTDIVSAVALDKLSDQVVSASQDCTLKVWSLIRKELSMTLRGHQDIIQSVVIADDGSSIISASEDKSIVVWK